NCACGRPTKAQAASVRSRAAAHRGAWRLAMLLLVGLLVTGGVIAWRVRAGAGRAALAAAAPPVWTNSLGMRFARLAPGTFRMGSPNGEEGRGDDEREHRVSIDAAFSIGVTEVTQ